MTSTDLKNQIDAQITNETAVAGITPTDVGSNMKSTVDYTNQEVALKAPLASPTFTGTVSGITKAMVGLTNVDNTSDLSKPISTATQSALDLKAPIGKTIGNVEADNISPYQTLSFDMNKVNTTGSVDKVVLPTTTVIGKEVIVFALNNGASFSVIANTAGTALLSPNGISSLSTSVSISANVSYRFIHLGDSYWKAELI